MARRRARQLPHHLRRLAAVLAALAVAGAVLMLLWPDGSGLYLFTVYSIPSNSILPVPHEPGLLYFAKFYDPLLIAIAGSLGTAAAAFGDYEVIERVMRSPRMATVKDSKFYRWSVKWLMRYPFATVVLFAATPLPVWVVRFLAPASGYSVWRYSLATLVGRLPRFYVLAWIGHVVDFPLWVLALLFVVLAGAMWWSGRKTPGASDAVRAELEEEEEEE